MIGHYLFADLAHLEEELEVLRKEHEVDDNKRLSEIGSLERASKKLVQEKEELTMVQ